MVIEKSKELLEKLYRTNYRQVPDFGMDTMSEMLIQIITNECKSTILTSDEEGNIQPRRYESDIIKENLHQIVRQLILNGGTIPKEVMNICISECYECIANRVETSYINYIFFKIYFSFFFGINIV